MMQSLMKGGSTSIKKFVEHVDKEFKNDKNTTD